MVTTVDVICFHEKQIEKLKKNINFLLGETQMENTNGKLVSSQTLMDMKHMKFLYNRNYTILEDIKFTCYQNATCY